jgi:hypothetical protein
MGNICMNDYEVTREDICRIHEKEKKSFNISVFTYEEEKTHSFLMRILLDFPFLSHDENFLSSISQGLFIKSSVLFIKTYVLLYILLEKN